jgi:hypothetical protein
MAPEIVLTSHSCVTWPGARNLYTAKDGWLLCIARGDLLHAAARRLIEENYDPASPLVIKDSFGAVPELRAASLADAVKGKAA